MCMSCLTDSWIVISPIIIFILGDLSGSKCFGLIRPIHQYVIKLHAVGKIPYIKVKLWLTIFCFFNLQTVAILNGKETAERPKNQLIPKKHRGPELD